MFDEALNLSNEINFQILSFLGFTQTLLVRRLDANEYLSQPCVSALVEQFMIARGVDRYLRDKIDWMVTTPPRDCCQQLFTPTAIGSEIIIRKEDRTITPSVQLIELRNHLVDRFMSLISTQVLDDVTKFTLERTAA